VELDDPARQSAAQYRKTSEGGEKGKRAARNSNQSSIASTLKSRVMGMGEGGRRQKPPLFIARSFGFQGFQDNHQFRSISPGGTVSLKNHFNIDWAAVSWFKLISTE